jgi:hypothetical protein
MAGQSTREPIISRDIQRFAIKVCIAAVVAVIAIDWIVGSAVDSVEESLGRTIESARLTVAETGGAPFWKKVQKALDDAAAEKLRPEVKQKLLRDLDDIIAQYRPFLDEAQNKLKEPARMESTVLSPEVPATVGR